MARSGAGKRKTAKRAHPERGSQPQRNHVRERILTMHLAKILLKRTILLTIRKSGVESAGSGREGSR
jgi:hypothetical protein